MFCPSCGTQDVADSNFCKRCGTNLSAVTLALAGKGQEAEVGEAARALAIQEMAQAQKKRRGLLTGGIINICVGIGIAIFLMAVGKEDGAPAGLIPLMIGAGLILSGLLLYKPKPPLPGLDAGVRGGRGRLQPPGASVTAATPESVTSQTTRRLEEQTPPERVTR